MTPQFLHALFGVADFLDRFFIRPEVQVLDELDGVIAYGGFGGEAGAGGGIPSPIPLPRRKNPLTAIEFDSRAWGAKSILKGEQAHGFLYFQTRHQRNAILYISGIREASTGKELFFAEVPVDPATPDEPARNVGKM